MAATMAENTSANGGLRIAYMALLDTLTAQGKTVGDKIDAHTETQRYVLGFAQVWCQNQADASSRQGALVDPHSPGKWRVNGSVRNFGGFGKAFGCAKGQPMYSVNSCRVWQAAQAVFASQPFRGRKRCPKRAHLGHGRSLRVDVSLLRDVKIATAL
jgi:predicted metalloendopeptidase